MTPAAPRQPLTPESLQAHLDTLWEALKQTGDEHAGAALDAIVGDLRLAQGSNATLLDLLRGLLPLVAPFRVGPLPSGEELAQLRERAQRALDEPTSGAHLLADLDGAKKESAHLKSLAEESAQKLVTERGEWSHRHAQLATEREEALALAEAMQRGQDAAWDAALDKAISEIRPEDVSVTIERIQQHKRVAGRPTNATEMPMRSEFTSNLAHFHALIQYHLRRVCWSSALEAAWTVVHRSLVLWEGGQYIHVSRVRAAVRLAANVTVAEAKASGGSPVWAAVAGMCLEVQHLLGIEPNGDDVVLLQHELVRLVRRGGKVQVEVPTLNGEPTWRTLDIYGATRLRLRDVVRGLLAAITSEESLPTERPGAATQAHTDAAEEFRERAADVETLGGVLALASGWGSLDDWREAFPATREPLLKQARAVSQHLLATPPAKRATP